MRRNVLSDPSVQTAWETLSTRINCLRFNVDERTMRILMSTKDMVKELTLMNLNAENAPNITDETCLHYQKMSNLCVYFATMSAVRHEMKKIFENSKSTAVNMDDEYGTLIQIPAGKSIDELFEEKEFQALNPRGTSVKFHNALTFERMLSVLLGCVSPRSLSVLVKTLNIHFKIIIFFKYEQSLGFPPI